MPKHEVGAYQRTQKTNMSPREVEAMAFLKAASLLEDAKGKAGSLEEFSKALRFNHLLWTIIQADITEPENQLPPEIKANVMSLSIFVDKQTNKALRTNTPADLDVLININRNLAAGLRENPDAPTADGAPPAAAPGGPQAGGGTLA
ncbi:flagellar biosynthesis regulator FlaF [Roseospirillum parvum]|uniref:Flagellar protein FlaF n=1 Tax=Roseospirillum parvum TaxID=83401 RepID=A0A1G8BPV4_9PROT|nr:flagellar biosynthesis regulator FlaF [Roseospirillum parvum]SDH35235.1 flagellar protein FlaF [Roseospirillum parvum]